MIESLDSLLNSSLKIKLVNFYGEYLPQTGGGVFDRYSHSGAVSKERLQSDLSDQVPTNVKVVSSEEYFIILGCNRFPE